MSVFSLSNLNRSQQSTAQKPPLLLIDDDPLNLKVMNLILDQSYAVEVASDATSALQILDRQANNKAEHIVVLDKQLPGTTMKDFIVALEQRLNNPFIIVLCTGKILEQDLESTSSKQVTLCKPVNPDTLLTTIEAVIAANKRRNELWQQQQQLTQEVQVISEQLAEKKRALSDIQQDLAQLQVNACNHCGDPS